MKRYQKIRVTVYDNPNYYGKSNSDMKYLSGELQNEKEENDALKAKLEIAVEALKHIYVDLDTGNIATIEKALADIEAVKR